MDVPAELFFVAFSFEFKVKMDRNEDFLSFARSFLFNVADIGGENELFVDSFVESSVPGSSRVEIIEPLGQGVLDFDIMAFDFSLQPEWKCRVMNSSLSSNIDLLNVVFGKRFQHLGPYIFCIWLSHL